MILTDVYLSVGLANFSLQEWMAHLACSGVNTKPPSSLTGVLRTFGLEVEVQLELCWMWSQLNVINFLGSLEVNPSIDEVLREDSTAS